MRPAHGFVEVHDGQGRPAVDLDGADGGDLFPPAVSVIRQPRLLGLHEGPEIFHLLELAHVELEDGLGFRVDHHHALAVDDAGVARLADLDLGEPGRQGVGRHDRGDGAEELAVLHDGHAEGQDGLACCLRQDHVAHDRLHLGLGLLEVVPVPEVDADVLPAVGVGEPPARGVEGVDDLVIAADGRKVLEHLAERRALLLGGLDRVGPRGQFMGQLEFLVSDDAHQVARPLGYFLQHRLAGLRQSPVGLPPGDRPAHRQGDHDHQDAPGHKSRF